MMKANEQLKKWVRSVALWLAQYKHEDVLYFRSLPENKEQYIYFVVLGEHCPHAEKFYEIFPNTMAIPEHVFNFQNKKGVRMILVGDAKDVDRLEPEETISQPLRVT